MVVVDGRDSAAGAHNDAECGASTCDPIANRNAAGNTGEGAHEASRRQEPNASELHVHSDEGPLPERYRHRY